MFVPENWYGNRLPNHVNITDQWEINGYLMELYIKELWFSGLDTYKISRRPVDL
jgi:hypothetical protein